MKVPGRTDFILILISAENNLVHKGFGVKIFKKGLDHGKKMNYIDFFGKCL